MRDFQRPGRSAVYANEAMAATSHPLATLVALDKLKAGGNAVDAAIAAVAVLGLLEPHMTGVGGDCWALIQRAGDARPLCYNGTGRAAAASGPGIDRLLDQGATAVPQTDPLAVTVPGAVEAWARLSADHGRLGLDRVLAPAIDLARAGAPVAPRVAADWACHVELLSRNEVTAQSFLAGARAPEAGARIAQTQMCRTLSAIAKDGPAAFYEGWIADDMVETLRGLGGCHSLDDFAGHAGHYTDPAAGQYRGRHIFETPPNSQGLIALAILAMIEGVDVAALDPDGPAFHDLIARASEAAIALRDQHLSDPEDRFGDEDGGGARIMDEARRLAPRIAAGARVAPSPRAPGGSGDTVYVTVVDRDQTAVSMVNSIFSAFGSGITCPRSGVLFNSRGTGFRLRPGTPGHYTPGRRPPHTLVAGMMGDGRRPVMSFGVMGGQYQAIGHATLLARMLDHGLDPQAAIDLPRSQAMGGVLELETGAAPTLMPQLIGLGNRVRAAAQPLGGAQAIVIDWERGVLIGGSDPRKDGCALGY
ncbi:gamma-glutamyltransferase [Tistrella bauzanensis]|uniref:Gamma-glutamyltransferase n=1 Tax=Tistrella bauzanensis TaxID=657419 RepID=A0ABQ1ICJ2_9PROT|nr:gamma-glutamyltransferase [Tistrella bauzanensis]GGB31584.1 gamma-glutamyltransferase [Tistrella bauzanensis]